MERIQERGTMLLIAVLFASLTGSPHCAGMCGGFVSLYSAGGAGAFAPHAAYNAGRLCAYLLLGSTAGLLGQTLDRLALGAGIQHAASICFAAVVFFWGISLWNGSSGQITHSGLASTFFSKLYKQLFRHAAALRPSRLAFSIGILSALLPCGWLYLYVSAAAGMASALHGALLMFVFWLGTLPIMLALGMLAARITQPLNRILPRLSAAILIVTALLSFAQHTKLIHTTNFTSHHCGDQRL